MVSTIEITRFFRKEFPDLNIYPIEYPLNSPVDSVIVNADSNTQITAGMFPAIVQVKVRDDHPSKAEETSYRFKNLLENKTNFYIGSVQIVLVKSQNPLPLYVGKDEKGQYLYSNNFRFLINEGVK